MAFENIGLGGVLSFESKGAVSSMGAASSAFNILGRSASSAQASVNKIGQGLGAFSMLGGLGVAGLVLGFKQLVHEGMAWNQYVETAKISIGTIMAAVTKVPLAQAIGQADRVLQHLNIVATQTHVETSEVVDTFSRLVGPMAGAGASLQQVYDLTKSTTIMASALHQPVNRASHAMSMLAGGTLIAREQTIQLLHSMGLLHETSQEWGAYLPVKRLERIKEIMATFEASGEYLQHTWVAQASSAKSFAKIMAGAFTKGMFAQGTDALSNFNNAFIKNQDAWLDKINQFGVSASHVITWLAGQVRLFVANVQSGLDWVRGLFDHIGVSIDVSVVKRIASIAAQFILVVTAMSPILAIVGFIVSKLAALWTIIEGIIGLLSAVALPLAAIAAAVGAIYLLFKETGEGPVAFFWRSLEYIQDVLNGIWASVQGSLGEIASSFAAIGASASLMWEGIQPGMDAFRASVEALVQFVSASFSYVMEVASILVDGFAAMFEAIRPGIEAVFNGIMAVVQVIADGANFLLPKIMAVLEPILKVIMFLGEKIAMVLGKAFQLLKPILDGIAYILKEVIFPIAGWLIDTFGPVITAVFEAIGWVLGKIADAIGWVMDKCGGLLEIVGGGLKLAFEAIGVVVKAIGWVLDTLIITPIKWLADKLIWIARKMQEISSGPLMDILNQETDKANATLDKLHAEGKYYYTVSEMVAANLEKSNKALADVTSAIQSQAQAIQMLGGLAANFDASTIKPLADLGISIIQAATGTKIFSDKNDVNVDVNVNNKMSMCVNGRQMSAAQAEYNTEVSERSGFNKTPWQAQRVQIAGTTQTGSKADTW